MINWCYVSDSSQRLSRGYDVPTSTGTRAASPRRHQLLGAAARLFAERGFHGVSIEDLGAAAGVSGPAVYRHFPSKDAVLAELLVGISEHLLAGGRSVVALAESPGAALDGLVATHLDFTLGASRDLIRVQDRDLANLSPARARRVRRLQRAYLELWCVQLAALVEGGATGVGAGEVRLRVQAVIGMLNSTPHSVTRSAGRDLSAARRVLHAMAVTSLGLPSLDEQQAAGAA